MGFGSYDESEQQDQEINADDDAGVSVDDDAHEGKLTFESDASTDELVDQLAEIKSANSDE